ncbi:MAG: aldose 1-epimerase [Rhizomicrobium sp.]
MNPVLTLSVGLMEARIAPEIGGALLSLRYDGRSLMRETPNEAIAAGNVRLTAGFPLVPYVNRIADGRFEFSDRSYRLATNFPDSSHPLHGIGWQRAWRVVNETKDSCVLAYESDAGDERDWPFRFCTELHYLLRPNGLDVSLYMTNREEFPAPAGLGFHPFFPIGEKTRVRFAAKALWTNDPAFLPLKPMVEEARRFASGWQPAGGNFDNDIEGWDGRLFLTAMPGDLALTMTVEPVFSWLRIFNPPNSNSIGVEPMTHATNAINRSDVPPMAVLSTGARLGGTIFINVS